MRQAGADVRPVQEFLGLLGTGTAVPEALKAAEAPQAAADFTGTTWSIIENAPVHCRAAAFAFGREDLIPDMFTRVIAIDDPDGVLTAFKDYLARHIEVDGEQHTPMAMQMLIDLCGDDQAKWDSCAETVRTALQARSRLWTTIEESFR
ncbi:DUF3050 domain-containing protein [Kitasatospora sp. NPDC051164]|uniref:DUF3050 domain-containing protein n=1 Tax=Kitasatospora sp. NPDC051164 TaxID=3364055 RepID=UPI003797FE08